jgi:acetolactate synthase-1/2/3 large subunit
MPTGAEIFIEALKREGVDTIFGYPGGVVLKLYDQLYDEPSIRHILIRHEQAGTHMADGYARASGKVGVALVTSGPAATNTVTGLANAYMDSIPIVVFTGQVATSLIGNDAFQEVDTIGITRPITKHNYLVKDPRDLPRIIKEAFYVARSGRPGPVVVDLPKDVSMAVLEPEEVHWPETVRFRGYRPVLKGHPSQVRKLVDAFLKAERPVFYIGGGVILSNASEELRELIDLLGAPITMTLMGLGAYPGTSPYSLGMLGMHGSYATNMAVTYCDLLVAIGARFDDRVTGKIEKFAPKALIAHIDIDPSSISKNVKVDIPIVGDAREVLRQILAELRARPEEVRAFSERIKPWWDQIRTWQKEHPLTYTDSSLEIKPQKVVEVIWELTRGDAIITADVGQHQMWVAQFYPFTRPRSWINSGGLGAMGFGFPAAIGAKVACPDRVVISVNGDGGILMNIQELATCLQYEIPVVVVIINNFYLGMVRQWQEIFYRKRYSHSSLEVMPDFVKLADAFGAVGMTVKKPGELKEALREAIALHRPVIVDVHVAREENVYPMVPAGAGLDEMLLA